MTSSAENQMAVASILQCVEDFLRMVTEGPIPSIDQLLCALDKLAVAYHQGTHVRFVDSELEPPRSNRDALYAHLSKRFPELGYYAVSDPIEVSSHEAMTGDAINDLADIVRELQEVIWLSKNTSAEEAIWQFCNLYQIHWGRHLRELALYLHARQF